MTLSPDHHRDLARLAVAALADVDLPRLHDDIVALATRLPEVASAGLFAVHDGTLVRLASRQWDAADLDGLAVPADILELQAATGRQDTALAGGAGRGELLALGRAGDHVVVLLALLDGDAIGDPEVSAVLCDAVQVAATAAHRQSVEGALRDSQRRLSEAQHLGRMGSYDWHIASDTNVWSDELYRIYGTEPQSFNASYERFLEFVHPDDRERIKAVHAEAYANGGAYRMEERIVRPDGDVRILDTTGEVVMGPDGTPERMVGVCLDVTERRAAERAAEQHAARFEALVSASPDAVLVIADDGTIVDANAQSLEVFGYAPEDLIGTHVDRLLPASLRTAHAVHRARYVEDPRPRTMAAGRDLFALHADGTEVPVDVSLGAIEVDGHTAVAAFVRDATERRHLTDLAVALHDSAARRQQALEINDSVVQGLTSVIYTLESGDPAVALEAARRTVQQARLMMNDLMEGSDLEAASSFVRATPAVSVLGVHADEDGHPPTAARPSGGTDKVGVLIVDDADDLRMLLNITVSSRERFEVLGEAVDGAQAIEQAEELRPDIILLDLAMPVMDGFEALPRLRAMLPDAAIVVLSGFDADRMERRAIELGADRYVEKGAPSARLLALLDELAPGGPSDAQHAPALPKDPAAPDPGEFGIQKLSHELRTPLTVIRSMIDTLHDQMDALPAAAVREILVAAARNADAMSGLIDSVAALQRLGTGEFVVAVEPADLGALVREQVGDLKGLTANHTVNLEIAGDVRGNIDPLRIRQVVTNLLSNATKFAPGGTAIDISVVGDGERSFVRVSDHGPGIEPERVPELFGRFARLGAPGRGMGIGLYISRAIARAHGGDLRYEPGADGGASFILEVPSAAAATTRPTASAQGNGA